MISIPGYSMYSMDEQGRVLNTKTGKYVTEMPDKSYKVKSDLGEWKKVSKSRLLSLVTPPTVPENFTLIPGFYYTYINTLGEVWQGPTRNFPNGKFLSIFKPKNIEQYPHFSAESKTITVHKALALTYLDSEYIDKGLCVMHLDDNKHNYSLSNLRIGTYSENNKAAYDSGANPGRS